MNWTKKKKIIQVEIKAKIRNSKKFFFYVSLKIYLFIFL